MPRQAIPYPVENSTAALSFTTENFRDSDYDVYVRQIEGSTVRDWQADALPPRNGHAADRSRAVPALFLGPRPP